jgi:predicted nucleic acid-binding protein
MSGKPFFDTNVLIYAVTDGDPRSSIARTLLAEGGVVSVHILNEFVAAARRKMKMPWPKILEALADFRVLCPSPVPITVKTHEAAVGIAERYGYGIYDSLAIAAALEAHADNLYSEDMRAGQKIQRLTIRNPF